MKLDNLVTSLGVDSIKHSTVRIADNTRVKPEPPQEGCRIEGIWVKKVPGNLVISATSGSHSFDSSQLNMSNVISSFSFDSTVTPIMMSDMKRLGSYLGVGHNRLNGQAYMTRLEDRANVTIQHYLQVVKTEVKGLSYQMIENYEYTAHTSTIHAHNIPAAKFHLEFSPMQVLITENRKPFSHFITNLCAIIGGVFTVGLQFLSLLAIFIRWMLEYWIRFFTTHVNWRKRLNCGRIVSSKLGIHKLDDLQNTLL